MAIIKPLDGRREIREHPTYPRATFVMNGLEVDLIDSQESTQGREIASLSSNGVIVRAISPDHPLLLLEEHPEVEGVGAVYDRSYAYGADERFSVNKFCPDGLELLLKMIISRSNALKGSHEGKRLRQFYPYATLDQDNLTARLLASEIIAPAIEYEIKKLAEYGDYHPRRCAYCDIVRQEQDATKNQESRVVFLDGYKDFFKLNEEGYIGFVPFAPKDKDSLSVMPLRHVSRLTELSAEQIKRLAARTYDSLAILREATIHRKSNALHVVFYSAPLDLAHNQHSNGFEPENYHFHVGVFPAEPISYEIPSYEIPGTGWFVVPGRPKDTAKKHREILENLVKPPA